jgi:lipoprotein-anchoring transpeptidase ErfK/SrfK
MDKKIIRKTIVFGICIAMLEIGIVSNIKTTVKADPMDGLVGYWNFNEGSGYIAIDQSGNGHNGTIYSATWATGISGNALYFDGIDDYVDVGYYNQFGGTQSFTLCAWINKTSLQAGEPSILNNMVSSAAGFALSSTGHQTAVTVGGVNDTWVQASVTNFSVINDGKWHFITGSYDGNRLSLYLDGNLVGFQNYVNNYTKSNLHINIARMEDGNRFYFNGLIDEIRIYDIALTNDQIYHLYQNPDNGNLPPYKPTITGPAIGKIRVTTEYNFTTIDPDNNLVLYFIDWGDKTNTSWIGPYQSGDLITKSHTWTKKGTFNIKAKAKDIHGNESDWATLSVTMPYSYNLPFMQFWIKLFEWFPHAFPILRHIMVY